MESGTIQQQAQMRLENARARHRASADEPGSASTITTIEDLPRAVERDRRLNVERIIELARWIVLIFAAVSSNFPGQEMDFPFRGSVNIILTGWALFNLSATIALLGRHLPGSRTQLATVGVDILVGAALVYLTGGAASNLGIAFFVVIIASSLRFGIRGSLICAAVVSATYFAVSLAAAGGQMSEALVQVFASRLFLFFVTSLVTGLIARELIANHERQMRRTFELEHMAFAELREVDRIKSEFMMLASHELRTPLTKIKAWLTLMHDAGDQLPDQARDEGLMELRQETEHLARLTDNLLCIAQLESGEIRLKLTEVSLEGVLRDVISRFVESTDRNRFMIGLDSDSTHCYADHERLALVLACLIDNALKFSPENEPVQILAHRVVNKVHLEVQDYGRRIPDSEAEKVFASFYQVENPLLRQRGGFGVGLYLSRQLVERMGGKIWIDNQRPRGNAFVITIPLSPGQTAV